VKRHPIFTFFVLTYAIAWGFVPFGSFGAFASLIAALIVIPMSQGLSGLKELGLRMIRWRVRWYWYVVALGLPLAVHLITVGLNVAAEAGIPPQGFTSLSGLLLIFAVRLVNPLDGPLGEDPGWRGFALPGLQGLGYSPLLATVILAVLITGWHLPLFFMGGGLPPSIVVTSILTTVAVTFWYTWLFNRTGGSVLLVILAHNLEGSIQAEGWVYMGVWLAVAIGLVVFNWQAWRAPAAAETTTPQTIPPRGAAPATPA
jgi:membrane protease YdiL (CAAX protease family)